MIAGALYLLGYAPYLWYVIRDKRAKPLWTPWLIFSAVETIALCEMRASNSDNCQLWCSMIGSWFTFIATAIYSRPRFKRPDHEIPPRWHFYLNIACLASSFVSIVIWRVCGQLTLGFMMSLIAIAIGMIPIFVSTWKDPLSEDKRGWTLFWFSCVFAVIAIPGNLSEWTLETAAQPISFLLTETIVMVLLWFPRQLTAKS